MADNVANVDKEDVLSSIRRLVADSSAREPVTESADVNQKLVLTPALRVLEEPEGAGGLSPEPADESAESSGAAPLFLHREQVVDPTPAVAGDGSQSPTRRLGDTIAGLESAVSGQPRDWEPDGSENEPVLDPPPAMFRSSLAERGVRPASEANDAGPIERTGSRLTLEPGSSETLVSGAADAGDFTDAHDEVQPDQAPPRAPVDDDAEEVLLDEETLRDMIRVIVREELQGAMGEKITGNIRRMIRREIHDYFDVADGE